MPIVGISRLGRLIGTQVRAVMGGGVAGFVRVVVVAGLAGVQA